MPHGLAGVGCAVMGADVNNFIYTRGEISEAWPEALIDKNHYCLVGHSGKLSLTSQPHSSQRGFYDNDSGLWWCESVCFALGVRCV